MYNSPSPDNSPAYRTGSAPLTSGKFVLITEGKIVGFFNSYYTACRHGFTHYEKGNFTVEKAPPHN